MMRFVEWLKNTMGMEEPEPEPRYQPPRVRPKPPARKKPAPEVVDFSADPGGRVEDTIEITAYEPSHTMAGVWSGGLEGHWESRFTEQGNGTLMALSVDMKPSGLMGKLEPIIGGLIRRTMHKDIEAFKKMVENN